MAFIYSHNKLKASISEKLEIAVKRIFLRIAKYRLYTRTVSELNSLPSRELADLGLSRSMIKNVAYRAVYDGCNQKIKWND